MWSIIEIILGLFIWMALPNLIFQKKTKKKAPYKRFTTVVCAFTGILIVVFGAIDLIKFLFNILKI
jgi:hypothetical protein